MIIKVQDVLYVSFDFNEIDDNIIVSYDKNNNTLFQTDFYEIEKFYNLTSEKFIKKTDKSIHLLTKISKDSSLYNLVSFLDNKIELLNKNNNKINKMLKTNNNDIYIKFKLSKDKKPLFLMMKN